MAVKFYLPSAFLIRYDEIDQEHRALVDLLNTYSDRFVDGKLIAFDEPLTAFAQTLERHFTHEERDLMAIDYAGLDAHRRHHATCRERVRSLIEKSRQRGYLTEAGLSECFNTIVADIVEADLKVGEYVSAAGLERPDE